MYAYCPHCNSLFDKDGEPHYGECQERRKRKMRLVDAIVANNPDMPIGRAHSLAEETVSFME